MSADYDAGTGDDVDAILRRLVAGEIDQEQARRLLGDRDVLSGPVIDADEHAHRQDGPARGAEPNVLDQLGGLANDIGSVAAKSLRRLFAPAEDRSSAQQSHSQPNQPGIERVRIRAVGSRVEIVGDPSVATVVADGPHRLRHSGDALEVIAEGRGMSVINGINPLAARGDSWRLMGPSLVLRVNPGIIVDAEVTGGGLVSRNLPKFGTVRVHVAGLQLKDVAQIQDGSINAGNASISGSMSQGRSRLSVGGGNLSIRLVSSSNVTIRSLNSMGHVVWPDPELQGLNEYVVGNGSGRLDIDVVVGRAKISVLPPGAA